MLTLIGACKHQSPETGAGMVAIPANVNSVLVHQGHAPIVYLLSAGGKVQVVDQTTGSTLGHATLAPQSAVRIDSAAGVILGAKTVHHGPLPADHIYGIYLERQ